MFGYGVTVISNSGGSAAKAVGLNSLRSLSSGPKGVRVGGGKHARHGESP